MADTTESGSGAHQADASGVSDAGRAAAQAPRYNPIRGYDPAREFKYIEEERAKVDARLLGFTGPFANWILRLTQLSMFAVVWASGVVPVLETFRYFGFTPSPFWHAVLILWLPALALLTVVGWLVIRLPIMLKWAAVRVEMYLDDEISNLLFRERDACRGELRGNHLDSNWALLRLLRLRMKAFHFWHRISIHTFILNGMFFRRFLETPLGAPRFWVHVVPLVVVSVFLSAHAGLLLGSGGANGGFEETARALGLSMWETLTSLRLGGIAGGASTAAVMAGGLGLAYLAYRLARLARTKVMARLELFLDTSKFLTPYTHDSSREIIAKHDRLIRMLARIVTRGRNGDAGGGGHELAALILDEFNHHDGKDDPV